MGARSRHARFMFIGLLVVLEGVIFLLAACSPPSPSPQPRISGTPSSTSTEPPLLQVSGLSLDNYRTQANVIVAVDRSRSMDKLWTEWRANVREIFSRVLASSGEFQLVLYPAEEEGMSIEPIRVISLDELPMIETSQQEQNGYIDALAVISDNIKADAENIVIWITDGSFHYENGRRDPIEAERQSKRFEDNFKIAYEVWEKSNYSISIYVFGYIDEEQRVGEDRQYGRDWDAWYSWERKGWLSQVEFYEEERNVTEDVENILLRHLCPTGTFKISYDNQNNAPSCYNDNEAVECKPYFVVTRSLTIEGPGSSFEFLVCNSPLVTIRWEAITNQSWTCGKGEMETAIVSIDVAEDWSLQDLCEKREFQVLNGQNCAENIAQNYQDDQCEEAPDPYTNMAPHVRTHLREQMCTHDDDGICYHIECENDHRMQMAIPIDIAKYCAFEIQINSDQATMSFVLNLLFEEGGKNGP